MAVNEQNTMTSHNLLNYSGMLFKKGDTTTPFSTLIGGKNRTTNAWQFVTSLSYSSRGGDTQPAITETQSLTAPTPKFSTREQATNVCQIFQEALAISYGKQSSMGQLSGLNIAGQTANPATELDFQVALTMEEIRKNIEYTFVNGTYQLGGYDDVAYKTRGILAAITTNVEAAEGAALDYWTVAEALTNMKKNGLDPNGVVLMTSGVHIMQLNADAVNNKLTVIPASREVNGIRITELVTPAGTIGLLENNYVAAGTAAFVNPSVCAPVYMDVPGKGNFFLEPLAKTGAADKYQIYGQCGLDYGAEWYHGKITGLETTFTRPE